MEKNVVPSTQLQQLNAWFEQEQRENGLIEMTFCPGSDREVSEEEAAAVALKMIAYARGR